MFRFFYLNIFYFHIDNQAVIRIVWKVTRPNARLKSTGISFVFILKIIYAFSTRKTI